MNLWGFFRLTWCFSGFWRLASLLLPFCLFCVCRLLAFSGFVRFPSVLLSPAFICWVSNNDWVIRVCARETAAGFWLVAWVFSFGSMDFRLYLVGYPTMTGSFTRVARETTGFVLFSPFCLSGSGCVGFGRHSKRRGVRSVSSAISVRMAFCCEAKCSNRCRWGGYDLR